MATIIRPTKEHSEAQQKITKALETILHTCDSEKIKQCNIEMDEAFATLNRTLEQSKTQHKLRSFVSTLYSDIFDTELK